MANPTVQTDTILCHCLQVRKSTVQDCVTLLGAETVTEVREACGAGGGCMACTRRIRLVIEEHQRRAEEHVPALRPLPFAE